MQHPVMRPAEPELDQDGIGLAREVTVGEEQQLDEGDQLRVRAGRTGLACPLVSRRPMPAQQPRIYVSHVDLFDPYC
jgi:hypothetical protein